MGSNIYFFNNSDSIFSLMSYLNPTIFYINILLNKNEKKDN